MKLPYAKANVTPGHQFIQVRDAETGKLIFRVIEANAEEGWFVQVVENRNGRAVRDPENPRQVLTRRIDCAITIEIPDHRAEGFARGEEQAT